MMTTEDRSDNRSAEVAPASLRIGVLGGTTLLAAAAGALAVGLGALLDGGDGAVGALTGAGVGVAVFVLGCGGLSLVARVLPTASLLVALLTYATQAVLLLVLFIELASVPFFAAGAGRLWFGLGMVTVTLAWMVAQMVLTARQPLPDGGALPGAVEPSEGPSSDEVVGGER